MKLRLSCIPVLVTGCLASCSGGEGRADPALTHTVTHGDLVITVRERGELKAAHDTRISSQLEGRATLIYLIPEGTIVAEGDKLAELDISGIAEKRATQAISTARAEATLEQARKNVEIAEKDLLAADKTAETRSQIAELRLSKFYGQPALAAAATDGAPAAPPPAAASAAAPAAPPAAASAAGGGVGPGLADPAAPDAQAAPDPAAPGGSDLRAAGTNAEMIARLREIIASEPLESAARAQHARLPERVLQILGDPGKLDLEMGEMANQILQQIDAISLTQSDLELAKQTLYYSRKLEENGFITTNELQRDEINYKRQVSAQTLAWNSLVLLINYTLPETLIGLRLEVENAQLNLASVRGAGDARRVREAAELKSSEAEYALARDQLANWDRQIENGTLRAPTPGLVVYARMDWDEPVYEGLEVHERQEVIILPDVSAMMVELKIPEAQIGNVAAGQKASIRVDAFPSRTFTGKVTRVSTLPDAGPSTQLLKVYQAQVLLDEDNSTGLLRPGMNSTVTIDVGTLPDVLIVPLPALERRGNVHYVWKLASDGPVATEVELGGNSLTEVQVLAGLQEGDRIYLVRPPGAQLPPAAEEPAEEGAEEATAGTHASGSPPP